ncbi:MAG: Flp pilus assembly complex ATPase component TadA [Deltaproteobacteria bacterium]|nr:Flp pilus assembly complex ATPase component TadA [Deltaproteobacteria bacterium]MBW2344021.1 Flp pilus assembly complex ATPase component TadA [Deltaproteobacteria bacterium]
MPEQKVERLHPPSEKKNFVDRRRLGELLVETGLLTRARLEEALNAQKGTGRRLGLVLVELEFISEDEMAFALAMQLKVPFIDLTDYDITEGVIESIPEEVCRKFFCIPIEMNDNVLHVSMADPLDLNMMTEVRFITGFNIQPAISTATQILDRLQKHYHPEKSISDVTDELAKEEFLEFTPEEEEIDAEAEMDKLQDSPFVKMVDLIIRNAIKKGASDVHVEAQENHVRVRNRVDGVLQESIKLPKWTQPIIISRIKVLGGMDIAERRLPQDGRIKVKAKNFSADLRVSTLPTFYGEKAVIRILNKQEASMTLDEIGFSAENIIILRRFIRRPQGMILITGPTGSGKTSTLYACMSEIKSDEANLITVEDPVEYELPGINQVQINEKVGLTFPFILRSILRQDPNVLMVGEIRDQETAEIALQASLTGHLVLSTLHTNDAASAVTRLIDIGIPPFMISSSLVGIIAQRLVRVICPDCKEEYIPNHELLSRISMHQEDLPFKFYRGAGCDKCNKTGFKGRTALEEIMIVGYKIRELIQSGATADAIREAGMATGMTTLGYSGLQKIRQGITTIEEVLRAVYQKEELTTICSHCGKAVSLDFRDCPFCKRPLVPTCETCKRIVQPEWLVCPYCRNDLRPEVEV